MATTREDGIEVLAQMLPEILTRDEKGMRDEPGFATDLGDIALENVFGRLWARPGLDRRSRSLVTLGILIALRADNELRTHLRIALRNGLTREELEEVIYHASGYAGFPAASAAGAVGREILDHPASDD